MSINAMCYHKGKEKTLGQTLKNMNRESMDFREKNAQHST